MARGGAGYNSCMKPTAKILLAVLGLVLVAALAFFTLRALRSQQPTPQAEPRDAWNFCQSVILAELRSPQTAVFTPYSRSSVTADSAEIYRVMMSLQTENLRGNLISLNALCRLRWDGEEFDLLGLQMR
jgi:hypothetical protein